MALISQDVSDVIIELYALLALRTRLDNLSEQPKDRAEDMEVFGACMSALADILTPKDMEKVRLRYEALLSQETQYVSGQSLSSTMLT